MKFFVVVTFALSLAIQAKAQEHDKLFYLKKSEKYRKMRNTGAILTVIGSGLMIGGVVTMANAPENNSYYNGQNTPSKEAVNGLLMYLGGAAAVGAGVPLWIVGGINHGRYERKFQSASGRLELLPNGLKFTYRF